MVNDKTGVGSPMAPDPVHQLWQFMCFSLSLIGCSLGSLHMKCDNRLQIGCMFYP